MVEILGVYIIPLQNVYSNFPLFISPTEILFPNSNFRNLFYFSNRLSPSTVLHAINIEWQYFTDQRWSVRIYKLKCSWLESGISSNVHPIGNYLFDWVLKIVLTILAQPTKRSSLQNIWGYLFSWIPCSHHVTSLDTTPYCTHKYVCTLEPDSGASTNVLWKNRYIVFRAKIKNKLN